jgi:hypothetical protein
VAKVATGVVDTGGKFAAGVIDTSANFATDVIDTGGCTLTCIYLRIVEKIGNDPSVIFRGMGKVIREKNLKQKIL